jgi:XRN 5'-3' exonuclease N-terminus
MFLAVDGVAPRAKMNQQRSRRFRSAKEAEQTMAELVARGDALPEGDRFDSNCITPGTDFMYNLGRAFRKWIDWKIENDPFWRDGARIVFSGPDVPGEGEHKVSNGIHVQKELFVMLQSMCSCVLWQTPALGASTACGRKLRRSRNRRWRCIQMVKIMQGMDFRAHMRCTRIA